MSGKLSSLSSRLAKVEQQQADRKRRAELANCACREITIAVPHEAERFEAEMNRRCPAHGFHRLGKLLAVNFVEPGMTVTEESAKLNQLVATYELRLSQLSQSSIEP
ncbi:MAG: hypothetical protein ABSF66_08205 [Terriglobales bacterium]|jgi:hypothetical protein